MADEDVFLVIDGPLKNVDSLYHTMIKIVWNTGMGKIYFYDHTSLQGGFKFLAKIILQAFQLVRVVKNCPYIPHYPKSLADRGSSCRIS